MTEMACEFCSNSVGPKINLEDMSKVKLSEDSYSRFVSDILSDENIVDKNLEMKIVQTMISERIKFETVIKAESSLNSYQEEIYNSIDKKLLDLPIGENDSPLIKMMKSYHLKKVTEEITDVRTDIHHAPAFIFVLNYNPKNKNHKEHISNENGRDDAINVDINSIEYELLMHKIAYEDGAVLISGKYVTSTNRLLDRLDSKELISKNDHISELEDESVRLGFVDRSVNARHKNSIIASNHLDGTVIYTLSEETGHIRRMENGRITHSTFPDEGVGTLYARYGSNIGLNGRYLTRGNRIPFSDAVGNVMKSDIIQILSGKYKYNTYTSFN